MGLWDGLASLLYPCYEHPQAEYCQNTKNVFFCLRRFLILTKQRTGGKGAFVLPFLPPFAQGTLDDLLEREEEVPSCNSLQQQHLLAHAYNIA